jgi:hypothetical protein
MFNPLMLARLSPLLRVKSRSHLTMVKMAKWGTARLLLEILIAMGKLMLLSPMIILGVLQ